MIIKSINPQYTVCVCEFVCAIRKCYPFTLHVHRTAFVLTLRTDPPDLPVAATPLQLTTGARSGHGQCHGCWRQSVHKGRLTCPCNKANYLYIYIYIYMYCKYPWMSGSVDESCFQTTVTLVHHSAKDIDSTWGGGAVPATIPELVLALSRWDRHRSEIKAGSQFRNRQIGSPKRPRRRKCLTSDPTSSMTISAALRTESMASPRALHTPTCPGVRPLSRAQGASPDTALERGSLARELWCEWREERRSSIKKQEDYWTHSAERMTY